MVANSKSISLAGAATLLLAIAAAITLASCMDGGQKYLFNVDGQEVTVWGAMPTCHTMESSLDGDKLSENPVDMLKQLKALSEETSDIKTQKKYYQRFYAKRLVTYAELKPQDACGGIIVSEFLKFFSICDGEKFKGYAKFVKHYAPDKFALCARKIIQDLDQKPNKRLDPLLTSLARHEFFRAGLGLEDVPSTHEQMYNYLKKVDLHRHWFNNSQWSRGSSSVAIPWANLFSDLRSTLFKLKIRVRTDVNIVNVARGIGAIREEELTPKFRLIDEYFRLAAQMERWDVYYSIKTNSKGYLYSDYSYHLVYETTVWERPTSSMQKWYLPNGNNYSPEPAEMLKELRAQLNMQINPTNEREFLQRFYTKCLVSYAELDPVHVCRNIDVREFLTIIQMEGDEVFGRYASFVKYYVRAKFAPCARQLLEDWDGEFEDRFALLLNKLNMFSRAALGIEDDFPTDQEMYYYIREVDLAEVEFDGGTMIKLLGLSGDSSSTSSWCGEKLIHDLRETLIQFKATVQNDVNIVNVAVGIGAIEEEELTPRFRLLNEYVRFAFQIDNWDVFLSIKKNLKV